MGLKYNIQVLQHGTARHGTARHGDYRYMYYRYRYLAWSGTVAVVLLLDWLWYGMATPNTIPGNTNTITSQGEIPWYTVEPVWSAGRYPKKHVSVSASLTSSTPPSNDNEHHLSHISLQRPPHTCNNNQFYQQSFGDHDANHITTTTTTTTTAAATMFDQPFVLPFVLN